MKHGNFIIGFLCGALLFGGTTAYAAGVVAEHSSHPIYVDGELVQMEAYTINGNNYVKLRDIGQAVGFNVFWQDGVQIDSDAPYTGEAPRQEASKMVVQDTEAEKRRIIALTNELRRANGLAALSTDEKLMEAAQVRADELAATMTYAHTRPDGRPYYTVTDCPYTAENLHRISELYLEQRGTHLASYAVDSWAESETHLKNMLNSRVSEIGVGLARGVNASGQDSWYCVQLFLYNGYEITWIDEPITE